MRSYDSPLRYPGGKSRIFPFVSKMFVENDLIGISYAEPYAGGAGLALNLLYNEYVARIYINDLDPLIFAFWDTVLNNNGAFCSWLEKVEVSVKTWRKFKEIQNHASEASKLELAKSTFFLNRTNVSGVITGGVIGGLEQKGKYKIDARFNRFALLDRIRALSRYRHRIFLSSIDGISFIRRLDRRSEEIFIYLDPPYFQKGADLYMNHYSRRDHQKLSKYVHKIKKRWMVSYDNHDFILKLFPCHNKILHSINRGTSNIVGDEIIVFSHEISYQESMCQLQSATCL